jgi:hypothetical protein
MSGLIAAIATGTVAVAGSISSFSQASKQNKKIRAAETEAKKAMAEAKKRLDVNVYEQLAIQKEPYELAREASLVAGTQALQTGVEGAERGAAATAGRVAMAQAAEQAQTRAAMGQELQGIQQQIVGEEARLADLGMGLNLEEAAGAQEAAANAEMLRAQAIQQGFEGLIQAGSAAASAAPLYGGVGGGGGAQARQNRRLSAPARQIARQSENVGDVLGSLGQYGMPQQRQQLGQPTLQQSQFTPPPAPDQFQQYLQGVGGQPDPYAGYGDFYNAFGRYIG